MALNPQNLQPVRTKDEARIRGAAGGRASGKARRIRRAMRDWLRDDLDSVVATDPDGNEMTLARYLARKHLNNVKKEVENGSTKEFVDLVELVDGKNVNVGGNPDGVPISIDNQVPDLTPDQVMDLMLKRNARSDS